MKKVFAVRHGEYDECGSKGLTPYGQKQSHDLAEKIKKLISQGQSVQVLSSAYRRAKETATIIGESFGVAVEVLDQLGLDDYEYGEGQRQAIMGAFKGAEVIIVVTHYKAPAGIMNAFRLSRGDEQFPALEIDKGNGMMIDMTTGDVDSDLLAST